jgi:probable F420-dependent oxidoreductase
MPRDTVRDVERKYYRSLDPFVVLTAAAAATTNLRLGFGIMLLPQRDPITTAKAIASLDYVSGGRVEVGIGAGWNTPEIENHGTPFDKRFGVMRERAEAMKAIWENDEATYHGRHVNFDNIMSWPKPVQKPHPPLWIGGLGEKVIDRVLRYGDGWFPNSRDPERDRLGERIAELRRRGEEDGRDRIPVTAFGVPIDAERVEQLAAAGVDRVLFMLPSAERAEVERAADEALALADRMR